MASPASKRERIRLNQQRSRARKHEYLQDLEKRVRECHTACREAELQREAYQQTHRENQKLRSWIASLGFSMSEIDALAFTEDSDVTTDQASLRSLRPKIQPDRVPTEPVSVYKPDDGHNFLRVPESASSSTPTSNGSDICCSSSCTSAPSATEEPFQLSLFPPYGAQDFMYCDIFQVCFEPSFNPTPENSISCSRAKELIEQYNIAGLSLDHLGSRLASGLTTELDFDEGCRVNRRLLFEVLDDLSANLS